MNVDRRILTLVLVVAAVTGHGVGPDVHAQTTSTPSITEAVAFTDTDAAFSGNTSVEMRFEAPLDESTVSPGEIEIHFRNGSTTVAVGVDAGAAGNDSQIVVDGGRVSVPSIEAIGFRDSASVSAPDGTTYSGNQIEPVSVTRTTTTVTEGVSNEDRPAFRGETVAIVGDSANEKLLIRSAADGDLFQMRLVPDDGQVYALDTTDLEHDAYDIEFDGDTGSADDRLLELIEYDLEIQVNPNRNVGDATVTDTETVTGTVSTHRVDQHIDVSIYDGDDEIRSTQVITNGSGVASFSFAPIRLDEADDHFTVLARHEPSATTAIDRIKVSQVEYDAGFEKLDIVEERGDVVVIPVVMSPDVDDKVAIDQATISIGSPDVAYQANVTVSDWNNDQSVLLRWNTYLADGHGGGEEYAVEPTDDDERDDSITVDAITTDVEGGPDDVLDSGTYDITVRSGAQSADEPANTTGVIFLTERETSDLHLSVAPDDSTVSLGSLEAIQDASENGELTRSDTVADGDQVVFESNVSGIGGAIEATESTNETVRFDQFLQEAATMKTVQTNPGLNRAPKALGVDIRSIDTVAVQETNDTYFIVVDLETTAVTRDVNGNDVPDAGEPVVDLADGDRFKTTFEIEENDGGLADRPQNVTVSWEYQDPTADIDRKNVEFGRVAVVEPEPSQTITGTSNVAPGTELTVRVRDDTTDWAYLEQRSVRVGKNGTFSATYSFAGAPRESRLSITVHRDGEELTTADGLVRPNSTTKTTYPNRSSTDSVCGSTGSTADIRNSPYRTGDGVYLAKSLDGTPNTKGTTTSVINLTPSRSGSEVGTIGNAVVAVMIVSGIATWLRRR